MKILKKGGGSREKGGGGNEIHAPCACEQNLEQSSVGERNYNIIYILYVQKASRHIVTI